LWVYDGNHVVVKVAKVKIKLGKILVHNLLIFSGLSHESLNHRCFEIEWLILSYQDLLLYLLLTTLCVLAALWKVNIATNAYLIKYEPFDFKTMVKIWEDGL